MCGICGIYQYGNRTPPDEEVLRDMLWSIRHRGPDDEGTFVEEAVALGMRRLSIIDLAGGKQPITNEDGSIALVFNGEIYNYRELTERLQRRGHTFATASDTEVIVHLYEELGDDLVHELRGMFTFAIWDTRRRRLLVARDRLGIKPLYYTDVGSNLVFGSEIKALLQHPAVEPRLDVDALGNFLSLKYVPAPQTMFAGIRALPPGYTLTCDANGIRVQQYWDLAFHPDAAAGQRKPSSEAEYAERLDTLLREAVESHLVADVPFGAFLSGGIDSSTIVALMSQILDQPVKTFSVGFDGAGEAFSELPYARLVAEKYRTDHHEVMIGADDFTTLAPKVIWHLDQPIADEASLANYMVSDLAARHVKMVLTGEGGDELFAGYARYAGERLYPYVRRIPQAVKSLALAASAHVPGLRRPKIALFALCQPEEARRLTSWFPLFNAEMKASLVSESLMQQLEQRSEVRVFAEQLARTDARDPLSRMLYVDTKLWLVDDLLARGDKTSMAASLEARVPLLDHKLVEFAATVPPGLKVKGQTRKYLLRKVSAPLLPPEVVSRKKKGFPIPTSLWFRNEARAYVRDVLSSTAMQQRGLFDPAYVQRLLGEHESGFADHGQLVWGLLGIELWHQLFIDQRPRVERPDSAIVVGSFGGQG